MPRQLGRAIVLALSAVLLSTCSAPPVKEAPDLPAATHAVPRSIVSLETWQFKLDPLNVGKADEWFREEKRAFADSQAMQVPSCWEEAFPDYDGVA